MADHNEFGNLAEKLAAEFLVEKGYKILLKNYRHQKAEIDLIAVYQNQLVVVEVKARSTDVFMDPQDAINKKKIRLLVNAADHFSQNYEYCLETRFDVITILKANNGAIEINHIENAFEAIDIN